MFEYGEFGVAQNAVFVAIFIREVGETVSDVDGVLCQVEFWAGGDGKCHHHSGDGRVYAGVQKQIPYGDAEEGIKQFAGNVEVPA